MHGDWKVAKSSLLQAFTIEIRIGSEAKRSSSYDCEHEIHPVLDRANDRLRTASDSDPGRELLVLRSRIDVQPGHGTARPAGPGDRLSSPVRLEDGREEVELFLEEHLVLLE